MGEGRGCGHLPQNPDVRMLGTLIKDLGPSMGGWPLAERVAVPLTTSSLL